MLSQNYLLRIILSLVVLALRTFHCEAYKPDACHFPFVYHGVTFNDCTDVNSDFLWCSKKEQYDGTSVSCSNEEIEQRMKRDNYYKMFNMLKDQEEKIKDIEETGNTNSSKCLHCNPEVDAFLESIDAITNIASDHMRKLMALKKKFIEKQKFAEAILVKSKQLNEQAQRSNRRRTQDIWYGTAPFCKGSCPSGQHQLRRDSSGNGKSCWSGWKVLCRRVYFV